nr:Hsp20/alpha crystallin family protein [bacterium]
HATSSKRDSRTLGLDEELTWRTATDAYTPEQEFVVQVDLGGMDPTGLEVLSDGESLTIRGTRSDIAPAGKKHYFKMEISVGPFARRLVIPVPVVADSAVARYRNGFLFVTFRKGDRRDVGRRRIDVNGGDK